MRRRLTIAVVAVVAAVGGAVAALAATTYAPDSSRAVAADSPTRSAAPSTAPSAEELLAEAVAADADAGACEPLARAMKATVRVAHRQKAAASAVTGLRESARLVKFTPWARQNPHHGTSLERTVRRLLDPLAHAAVVEHGLPESGDYRSALLGECDLEQPLGQAERTARSADSAISKLQDRARRAPWWPIGYTQLNRDVAWQPYSSSEYSYAPCDISFSACLKGRVVTRVRCQSVYLEANVYDAGRQIVDWSNDSLGVINSGETAVVDFVSFVEGHLSWRVTNVACN